MITLIHPSFGRPLMAFKCFNEWTSKAGGQFEYILSLDKRDTYLSQYEVLFNKEKIIITDSENCVQATNEAAKVSTGDIIVYLSDDFSCPENWDKLIIDNINVDKPELLKVNDGLQPFDNTVLTIPIMTRKLYEQLGYFWFPEYKSMWVDVDLYFTCKEYLVLREDLLFQHNHHSRGAVYDATYQQHDNPIRFSEGMNIVNRRAKENQWGVQF